MSRDRPRIAVVTRTWGGEGDGPAISRLIAGALALHGETEIVHLSDEAVLRTTRDSVFDVHTVPLVGAHPARAAIALAAASVGAPGAPPRSVLALLDRWEGEAPAVPVTSFGGSPPTSSCSPGRPSRSQPRRRCTS